MNPIKYTFQAFALIAIFTITSAVFAGENIWTSNGPYGGSVTCISVHPQNNQILYCGTVENGLYKSTNGGGSWVNLPSSVLDHNMRDIAIHPVAPDTIYAATAGGMYKSSDSGFSWALMEPPAGIHNEIRTLVIHPIHHNVLLAGGPFYSQWKSTDSGNTWQYLNIAWPVSIEHFAIDPENPDIIYFASGSVLYAKGVWKSTDMGESWFPVQNNIDTTFTFGTWVEIDPVNSDILYFARSDPYDTCEQILSKSTDGGNNWFDITPPNLSSSPAIFSVAISPQDHNTVYVCTYGDGFLKSINGGISWEEKNLGLRTLEIEGCVIDSLSGALYIGTFKDGIYKSLDGGDHWQPISQNISASQCIGLATSQIQSSVVFCAALNGLFRSNDHGENWQPVNIEIPITDAPAIVAIDRYNSNWIFLATLHNSRSTGMAGFWRSTDNGANWNRFSQGLPGEISYLDMAISYGQDQSRRIFIASEAGVYFSDNLGENWYLCSNGIPSQPIFLVVEVARSNQNVIIAGEGYSASNKLYLSADRGNSWAQTTDLPSAPNAHISAVEFDPIDENHIYISSAYNGLFESFDAGNSWIDLTGNLPVDPHEPPAYVFTGLAINPFNNQNIFAASSHVGIFQSHDSGQSWHALNSGLDTSRIFGKVHFDANDTNYLYHSSQVNSVWSIHRTVTGTEESEPALPEELALSSYPNPFNAMSHIKYELPSSGNVTLEIYDPLGRKLSVLLDQDMPAGSHSLLWDAAACPSGVYFMRLKFGDISRITKTVLLK